MQKENNQSHLHEELIELVKQERRITSKILDLLQQVENKKSYLGWGYSEALAYQRKAALKICQAIPEFKAKLDQ